MKLVTIIALGDKKWADYALNCCLSIRKDDFDNSIERDYKIVLITDTNCFKFISEYHSKFFDYQVIVEYSGIDNPIEKSFYVKTRLYDIVDGIGVDWSEAINLDADSLMLPNGDILDLFKENIGLNFSAYCNDIFDFKENSSKRDGYTFWCDPLQVKEKYPTISKMPQLNTSFMYFSKGGLTKSLFELCKEIWLDNSIDYKKYKGVKPDELCFNIACSILNILPKSDSYRPVFMQFASENQNEVYISHQYKVLAFAGDKRHSDLFKSIYHKQVDYYRSLFGVNGFSYEDEVHENGLYFIDESTIDIHPKRRRTRYRENEIDNSGAGIFNPDAITLPNGDIMEIYRKEKDWDAYGRYKISTAIPFIVINNEKEYELNRSGFVEDERLEDFRIFNCNDIVFCNHSIVLNNHTPEMEIKCCLSYIHDNMLCKIGVPNLPLDIPKIQKNWVYFSEGDKIFLIYSISPYILFVSDSSTQWSKWDKVNVIESEIDFIHKSYISNSTNPIKVNDREYLTFFHTKERGIYYKGAAIIDSETKNITHYTKHTIPFNARNDGMHKGILYVSGLLLVGEDTLRVYYGEGDSHSCYADYDKQNLIDKIKQSYENR